MFVRTILVSVSIVLATQNSLAASLKASCQLLDDQNQKIEGINLDARYPIASVSKIMTSFWAVSVMGAEGRFETRVYLRKVSNDSFDVHLAGSRDPYFSMDSLQFLVAELNRNGVRRVRRWTFDQNFKYTRDAISQHIAHLAVSDPSDRRVQESLQEDLSHIQSRYTSLRNRAEAIRNMNLPAKIQIAVDQVEAIHSDNFDAKQYDQAYLFQSAPLSEILKEMNRNSNNYAANNIFESLGGSEKFTEFIQAKLGLDQQQIRFVNGSGDFSDQSNNYNEASCRAVIEVVQGLRSELKKQNKNLYHVLAVTGRAASGTRGTIDMYNNEVTEGALIAKTGTVNPAITLAGMASTQEGGVYFGYIYKTDGGGDWGAARGKIRLAVTRLIEKYGGAQAVYWRPIAFLSFDKKSSMIPMGH